MVGYLKCKSCGSRFLSPMEEPPQGVRGPPGTMVTACPHCAKNVDILYDQD